MVRRTKADAEATRHSLLDAAELLFQARGVSRTSLNDIAVAAGTTRGAIYWHFKDKADLFNAMMDRAVLPLEQALTSVGDRASELSDPLQALRSSMRLALNKTATDPRVRRAFEVATLQVEYNEEMHAVRQRHLQVRNECISSTALALKAASTKRGVPLPIALETASLGLHVMVDGLIHNWMLDPTAFDLEACGEKTVETYLRGLGFGAAITSDAVPAPQTPAAPHLTAPADAKPPAPSGSPTQARSRKRTR
ncbi:TetR family transcriptional regulator [Hydrogenophaga crassostreae]|uniref:HTH tetR-type domain-containing protein n=1 Tax=Hydrogenophaga crassostreae TaxID=1763535 RepID=A0A1D8NXH7_9BURK|nr:TetR family transcriptional regulator [Hydrogenophaga crassostreae]AOW13815.1 hypothetical protein LPB072_14165 [Hydrogenophaga crassostreae]